MGHKISLLELARIWYDTSKTW